MFQLAQGGNPEPHRDRPHLRRCELEPRDPGDHGDRGDHGGRGGAGMLRIESDRKMLGAFVLIPPI